MAQDDPITTWIEGIRAGDAAEIRRLWDQYFDRLVRLAGSRLPSHCRRAFDEEDVAISAFRSFCDRAGRGQFPQLDDRDDLWRVLATITVRKSLEAVRHQTRQKRGGGNVLGESALIARDQDGRDGVAAVLSREPSPEDVAHFIDDCHQIFDRLGDPALRVVALLRLEGRGTQEIARALDVSTKTVDRKLRLIRAIWGEGKPR